jgi:phage shock protein A
MFKTLITLMRGTAAATEEELIDNSALLILDQQMRDAASATERAKRALALAIAQDEAEAKRLESTLTRITDLEKRAVEALAGNREDLAGEAAEAIALLESDRDAILAARSMFAKEIAHMKAAVTSASQRLAELDRGRRIAQAAEAVRHLRAGAAPAGLGSTTLAEAERTLTRLRERQNEEARAAAAFSVIEGTGQQDIARRLEDEGFGPRTRPTAASVLSRLRQMPSAPSPAAN